MMNLHLIPITDSNRDEILSLHIADAQEGFVESVAQCLSEADKLDLWRPTGIYDGSVPVGFAMYGLFQNESSEGKLWLDRFLIDEHYQKHGYGKAALAALIARIHSEYRSTRIYLSVVVGNNVAAELYQHCGFRFNGEHDINGEDVMIYDFALEAACPLMLSSSRT
ncbi:MAG: GNAT family N-acetyltransferase [Clostridia bacterium]